MRARQEGRSGASIREAEKGWHCLYFVSLVCKDKRSTLVCVRVEKTNLSASIKEAEKKGGIVFILSRWFRRIRDERSFVCVCGFLLFLFS